MFLDHRQHQLPTESARHSVQGAFPSNCIAAHRPEKGLTSLNNTRTVHWIHVHLNTLSHSTKAEKDQLKPSSKCMKLRAKNPELKKRGRAHNIFLTHSPWRNKSCVSILTFKTLLSLSLFCTHPSLKLWCFRDSEVWAECLEEPCYLLSWTHALQTPQRTERGKLKAGLRLWRLSSLLWAHLLSKGCKLHCHKLCTGETQFQWFHWRKKLKKPGRQSFLHCSEGVSLSCRSSQTVRRSRQYRGSCKYLEDYSNSSWKYI